MPTELLYAALSIAIACCQPRPGLIGHTDCGSQCGSQMHTELITEHGLIANMSRRAHCWDNLVMESFFLNLKMKCVWRRHYTNHAVAQRNVTDYIVSFYNSIRLHSILGYRSPIAYEQQTITLT